jgi:tripartite-type tricarboxylate transporter receptor subunit TctC
MVSLQRFSLSMLVTTAIAAISCACAQAASTDAGAGYPTRPIRFVIGPSPDLLARIVGQKLTESWGQQVIVDARTGAAGAIAVETVSRAAPDGYTWLMSSSSIAINQAVYPTTPYDLARDVAPVGLMATIPFVLVVNPSVAAQSVGDLIKLARAQPGKLNYGSSGNGTAPHLAGEWLKMLAGIDMVHVPYKAVPPAVVDLLGNQIQLMFVVAQAAVPHMKSGKLRALAISSGKRSATLADLPTIAELGFAGFDITGWLGVHVPPATPRALIERINADVRQALEGQEVRSRMAPAGMDAATSTPAQFGAFVKNDITRYSKVVKDARIKIE